MLSGGAMGQLTSALSAGSVHGKSSLLDLHCRYYVVLDFVGEQLILVDKRLCVDKHERQVSEQWLTEQPPSEHAAPEASFECGAWHLRLLPAEHWSCNAHGLSGLLSGCLQFVGEDNV